VYIVQHHVDEYVVIVRSGDLVTKNYIRGDLVDAKIALNSAWMIGTFDLEDEGPETPVHSDWELWD
jgi:hypothetical protein